MNNRKHKFALPLLTSLFAALALGAVACAAPSHFDCCVDGKVAKCDCPANASCDPVPFADCGDGTCIVNQDTCSAGEGEGEGAGQ